MPDTKFNRIKDLSDDINFFNFVRNKIRNKLPVKGTENVINEIIDKSNLFIIKKSKKPGSKVIQNKAAFGLAVTAINPAMNPEINPFLFNLVL